jgi:hypothetical protein
MIPQGRMTQCSKLQDDVSESHLLFSIAEVTDRHNTLQDEAAIWRWYLQGSNREGTAFAYEFCRYVDDANILANELLKHEVSTIHSA